MLSAARVSLLDRQPDAEQIQWETQSSQSRASAQAAQAKAKNKARAKKTVEPSTSKSLPVDKGKGKATPSSNTTQVRAVEASRGPAEELAAKEDVDLNFNNDNDFDQQGDQQMDDGSARVELDGYGTGYEGTGDGRGEELPQPAQPKKKLDKGKQKERRHATSPPAFAPPAQQRPHAALNRGPASNAAGPSSARNHATLVLDDTDEESDEESNRRKRARTLARLQKKKALAAAAVAAVSDDDETPLPASAIAAIFRKRPSSSQQKSESKKQRRAIPDGESNSSSSSSQASSSDVEIVSAQRAGANPHNKYAHNRLGRIPWPDAETAFFMRMMEEYDGNCGLINRMHGEKGIASTKLKLRNPVSLRDKARNIAMKMQRTGQQIPRCLQRMSRQSFSISHRSPTTFSDSPYVHSLPSSSQTQKLIPFCCTMLLNGINVVCVPRSRTSSINFRARTSAHDHSPKLEPNLAPRRPCHIHPSSSLETCWHSDRQITAFLTNGEIE